MNTRRWLATAIILIACAFIAGAWLVHLSADTSSSARRDFTLTDTAGRQVTLATYQGKWLVLFFGFTNCPDACPTAMINVSQALKSMGSLATRLQPIFITIDPKRDTPALLKDYLSNFDGNIVGLSGTDAETAAVAKNYGVYYQPRATDAGYTVDHSTALYLVSPQGEYVRPFRADLDPGQLAQDLTAAMTAPQETKP
jgi:protein SCO1/2